MTVRRIDSTEPNRVESTGASNARIMIVGDCPTETDVRNMTIFTGLPGIALDDILSEANIRKSDCYFTNLVKTRPVAGKMSNCYDKGVGKIKRVAKDILVEGLRELENDIARVGPHVIVALGNEAMKALVGFDGVDDYRGSVLRTSSGVKVIPTIHPKTITKQWSMRPAVVCDFKRVLEESKSKEYSPTYRELVVCYNSKEAINELSKIKEDAREVAFDIETESDQVTCISFSNRLNRAICIPFWFGGSGSLHAAEEERVIWGLVSDILFDERIGKIAHNGAYDIGFLKRIYGIDVRGFVFDTMVAMHALYLEFPKSLAFATSIYTDQAYYKYMRQTVSMDTHFEYNAIDSCVTYEIAQKLRDDLQEERMLDFYRNFMHPLIEPLLSLELRGVAFNTIKCSRLKREYTAKIDLLQKELDLLTGGLNVNSHTQMVVWLYDTLKYPKISKVNKETGVSGLTADNSALLKCLAKKDNRAIRLVIEIRELKKILSTYLGVKLDADKRIRCAYNLTGTETGRLSSSATLRGTGTNLQNIPEGDIKSLFIPDEGKLFINADLSQAEARVVAYLSNEERLIRIFNEGGDIHRKNASNMFGIKEEDVTNDQRQMAKRVVHASNYGMGPRTFAAQTGIAEARAKQLLNQYFVAYPRIKIWHLQIQETLRKCRQLTTPYGRKRIFFNRWTDSLFKEGLAYIPQSTVADMLNQSLLVLWNKWKGLRDRELLLQVHDSLLVQCDMAVVSEVIREMKSVMEAPILINNRKFSIPSDYKIGFTWNDMVKWTGKEDALSINT